MKVWQNKLSHSEFLIKIFLVKVTWLSCVGVEYKFVLFLGDFDTGDPGSGVFRQFYRLLRVATIIQPKFHLIFVQVQAHSHCAGGCCLETGQMI